VLTRRDITGQTAILHKVNKYGLWSELLLNGQFALRRQCDVAAPLTLLQLLIGLQILIILLDVFIVPSNECFIEDYILVIFVDNTDEGAELRPSWHLVHRFHRILNFDVLVQVLDRSH
jgi:hypothetical protein